MSDSVLTAVRDRAEYLDRESRPTTLDDLFAADVIDLGADPGAEASAGEDPTVIDLEPEREKRSLRRPVLAAAAAVLALIAAVAVAVYALQDDEPDTTDIITDDTPTETPNNIQGPLGVGELDWQILDESALPLGAAWPTTVAAAGGRFLAPGLTSEDGLTWEATDTAEADYVISDLDGESAWAIAISDAEPDPAGNRPVTARRTTDGRFWDDPTPENPGFTSLATSEGVTYATPRWSCDPVRALRDGAWIDEPTPQAGPEECPQASPLLMPHEGGVLQIDPGQSVNPVESEVIPSSLRERTPRGTWEEFTSSGVFGEGATIWSLSSTGDHLVASGRLHRTGVTAFDSRILEDWVWVSEDGETWTKLASPDVWRESAEDDPTSIYAMPEGFTPYEGFEPEQWMGVPMVVSGPLGIFAMGSVSANGGQLGAGVQRQMAHRLTSARPGTRSRPMSSTWIPPLATSPSSHGASATTRRAQSRPTPLPSRPRRTGPSP